MPTPAFLAEGQLLRDAGRLAEIPVVIVQGRYDVICPPITAWELHRRPAPLAPGHGEDAGHSGGAPPMRRALVEAVSSLDQRSTGGGRRRPLFRGMSRPQQVPPSLELRVGNAKSRGPLWRWRSTRSTVRSASWTRPARSTLGTDLVRGRW